jgi:hypothetical protein
VIEIPGMWLSNLWRREPLVLLLVLTFATIGAIALVNPRKARTLSERYTNPSLTGRDWVIRLWETGMLIFGALIFFST